MSQPNAWIGRAEWTVAGLLTLLALGLHVAFFTHAGALWRDEANSVAMATTPTLEEAIEALPYDGFPLLPTVVLRGWTAVCGDADAALRVFGLLVGIAFIAGLWIVARWYRVGAPLLSLALVGANPLVVTSVASVRPYGLGVIGVGLTAALVAKAVAAPSTRRFLWAAMAALVSVQCLFQNAVLLLAVGIATIAMAARGSRARVALGISAVGAVAAASLIPYVGSIRAAQEWNVLNQGPGDFGRIAHVLSSALGASGPAGIWVWIGAAALGVWAATRPGGAAGPPTVADPIATRFGAVLAWAAAILFLGAMWMSRLPTQPWYYVPLLTLAAPALEAGTRGFVASGRARVARLLIVLAIVASGGAGWKQVSERRTNMDRVAAHLERDAVRGDAIVVAPWYLGISFHRYYRGVAEWTTLPPLEDTRIHRYDLLKAAMQAPDPVAPMLEAMSRALESGHRVWLVGGLPTSLAVDVPSILPPAPHPATGWSQVPYLEAWSRRAVQLLRARGKAAEMLPLGLDVPVQPLEAVPLVVVSGRQGDRAP